MCVRVCVRVRVCVCVSPCMWDGFCLVLCFRFFLLCVCERACMCVMCVCQNNPVQDVDSVTKVEVSRVQNLELGKRRMDWANGSP